MAFSNELAPIIFKFIPFKNETIFSRFLLVSWLTCSPGVISKTSIVTTLQLAKDKALEKGIKNVAIASIRGQTAKKAIEIFKDTDINVTIVGCNGCNECPPFSEEIKKQVENAGYQIIFVPEGSIPYPDFAQMAYRRICEGMKVCVFISMGMAEKGIVRLFTLLITAIGLPFSLSKIVSPFFEDCIR